MAFEDSLILSILGQVLNDAQTTPSSINTKLKACLNAYDHVRRPRTQKFTSTSRDVGEIMEFATASMGSDLAKIKANLDTRMNWIWDVDLLGEVKRGVEIARGESVRWV
jgi:salicylate hydroxylase